MTLDEIRTAIDERLDQARRDCEESKISPNSYGHGYDSGFRDALLGVKRLINGEEEP